MIIYVQSSIFNLLTSSGLLLEYGLYGLGLGLDYIWAQPFKKKCHKPFPTACIGGQSLENLLKEIMASNKGLVLDM